MARNESSHSAPSAKEPRAIQQGWTPAQMRSPDSASALCQAPAQHLPQALPPSTSYRRNTSTRAGHGAGICAMPSARLCSTALTV